jgi:hypothetical protein
MNKNPFILLKFNTSWILPRILLTEISSIRSFYFICRLETIAHCFKFIKKSFLTDILNKIYCWYSLISCMIKLPQLHRNRCRKTTFNTKTYKRYISTFSTLKFLHLFFKFWLTIYCILTIRNKYNCNR